MTGRRPRWALAAALALAGCASSQTKKQEQLPALLTVEGWAKSSDPGAPEKALADARREAVSEAVRAELSPAVFEAAGPELSDKILPHTTSYIEDQKVLAQGKEGEFYKIKLQAAVHFDRVGKDLKAAGLLKTPKDEGFRIGLAIAGPDAALRAAAEELKARGFDLALRSAESLVPSREPDGPRAAAAAKKAGVRYILAGSASAQPARALGAWDAVVRLWIVDADRAEAVAKFEGDGSAQGESPDIAQAKALSEAAQQAAGEAALDLQPRMPHTAPTLVKVDGVGPPRDLRAVMDKLRAIEGVQTVTLEQYDGMSAAVAVWSRKRSSDDLAADLMRDASFSFDVRSVLPGELEIERR